MTQLTEWELLALALLIQRRDVQGDMMADAMEWARQTYQLSDKSLARVVREYDRQHGEE